jgi:hypothetical protein
MGLLQEIAPVFEKRSNLWRDYLRENSTTKTAVGGLQRCILLLELAGRVQIVVEGSCRGTLLFWRTVSGCTLIWNDVEGVVCYWGKFKGAYYC